MSGWVGEQTCECIELQRRVVTEEVSYIRYLPPGKQHNCDYVTERNALLKDACVFAEEVADAHHPRYIDGTRNAAWGTAFTQALSARMDDLSRDRHIKYAKGGAK
jgi:hypothetical protein